MTAPLFDVEPEIDLEAAQMAAQADHEDAWASLPHTSGPDATATAHTFQTTNASTSTSGPELS